MRAGLPRPRTSVHGGSTVGALGTAGHDPLESARASGRGGGSCVLARYAAGVDRVTNSSVGSGCRPAPVDATGLETSKGCTAITGWRLRRTASWQAKTAWRLSSGEHPEAESRR